MFRAMITLPVPVSATDADNIVDVISNWVKSNPSVRVDEVILDIDPDCPAMLESVTADDCASVKHLLLDSHHHHHHHHHHLCQLA